MEKERIEEWWKFINWYRRKVSTDAYTPVALIDSGLIDPEIFPVEVALFLDWKEDIS